MATCNDILNNKGAKPFKSSDEQPHRAIDLAKSGDTEFFERGILACLASSFPQIAAQSLKKNTSIHGSIEHNTSPLNKCTSTYVLHEIVGTANTRAIRWKPETSCGSEVTPPIPDAMCEKCKVC